MTISPRIKPFACRPIGEDVDAPPLERHYRSDEQEQSNQTGLGR